MNPLLSSSVLQGRLDFFRSISGGSPLSHAEFQETGANVFYISGIDYAPCNGLMEKDENRIPTEEEIDRCVQIFSAKKLPFIWWTGAKVLENKGFQFGGILTGIAFGMDEKAALGALAVNASAMRQGEQLHLLALVDNVPVGTATLSTSAASTGVWNLATLPEYRKQGVGAALVHAALIEAQKRQYSQVMAILMPKGMAWGLFTKLGFQKVCDFPFYVFGASAEEIEKS